MQTKNEERVYAGFFVRLAAYLVDSLIIGAALLVVRVPVWIVSLFRPDNLLVRDLIFQYSLMDILCAALTAAYFILMTYMTGATLGKKLFHLCVVSSEDRKPTLWELTVRETVGRFLSALILCAGYLVVGIQKEKRGLHDWFADTRVIYRHVKEKKVPVPVAYHEVPTMGAYSPAEYYKPVETEYTDSGKNDTV